jgi:hypothetical protein
LSPYYISHIDIGFPSTGTRLLLRLLLFTTIAIPGRSVAIDYFSLVFLRPFYFCRDSRYLGSRVAVGRAYFYGIIIYFSTCFVLPKLEETIRYIYDQDEYEYDWFVKVDDDSYIFVETIRYFLSNITNDDDDDDNKLEKSHFVVFYDRRYSYPPLVDLPNERASLGSFQSCQRMNQGFFANDLNNVSMPLFLQHESEAKTKEMDAREGTISVIVTV